jgi:hypothetical protein
MNLPEGPEVPQAYLGVWKRTLLRTPQREDTTTQVYWMQTKSWHADNRVPAGRPAFDGKTALDQMNKAELMELAKQQGFCGTTVVDEDTCRWLRRHDFQPPSGANDIGRMEFDGSDRVLEYGVEAEYFEIWERLPGSKGKTSAVLVSDDPVSLLLSAGEYVMSVRPRVMKLPTANNLSAYLEGKNGQILREALDFEISFGRRAVNGLVWSIELSTLPWRRGAAVSIEDEPIPL